MAGLKTFAILAVLLASGSSAPTPKFRIAPIEPRGHFMVLGQITNGFEDELRLKIAQNPKLKRIYIESPGGLILEASRAARLLNEHGISVRVAGKCASACVHLWAAVDRRELTNSARLGLHAGRPKKEAPGQLEKLAAPARQKIADDMLRHAGFSDLLIAKARQAPNDSILWLTPAELSAAGVRFTLIEPATQQFVQAEPASRPRQSVVTLSLCRGRAATRLNSGVRLA